MDETGVKRSFGGNVEPLDRGFVDRHSFRAPAKPPAERFELHDPRADLTYRTKTFVEMVTKANQIGATRFTAISPDGTRSKVSRIGGTWQREDAAQTAAPPAREQPGPDAKVVPLTPPTPIVAKNDADAERTARIARIEAALHERYLIKRAPIRIGDDTIRQNKDGSLGDQT